VYTGSDEWKGNGTIKRFLEAVSENFERIGGIVPRLALPHHSMSDESVDVRNKWGANLQDGFPHTNDKVSQKCPPKYW
jgi:hypothetical protein